MKTNDIKKGTRIKLRNGWEAIMEDNRKGNTRMAKVFGMFTEIGSVYSHDIVAVQREDGSWNYEIEYTKSQKECKAMAGAFGF